MLAAVDEMTRAIEAAPLTSTETEELISATAAELGWSRDRVIADGVLRLWAARHAPNFRPVTP
jgi:hypothetical protein